MNDLCEHEGIRLVPYVKLDGAYILTDAYLHWLWARFEEEGTAEKVWLVGEVAGGDAFVEYMRMPGNLPIFFFEVANHKPLGMAWLNGISGNHAFVHHALLKASWGRLTDSIAHAAFRYWFGMTADQNGILDVIIGQTPSNNRKAVKFLKRVGFTVIGEIPKIAGGDAMTISYLERDNGQE